MPGALDTNGIWQYAESDVAGAGGGGTFSGLLNKLAASVSTVVGGFASRISALELAATLAYSGAPVADTTASGVIITFDSTDIANTLAGAFTITRSTGKFVCAKAGTWEFTLDADWAAGTTGVRQVYINKALAATPTSFVIVKLTGSPAPLASPGNAFGRFILPLAVGDVVTFGRIHSQGTALNFTGAHLRIRQLA